MKKTHDSEMVTETELGRLCGKSRDWIRPRLQGLERDEQGRVNKTVAMAILGKGELCNPLRWISERSIQNFIEELLREENADLWETALRGILNIFAEGYIDADQFSRALKAHGDEDIDELWRRIIGPAARAKFHDRRATDPLEDFVIPGWLAETAMAAQEEMQRRP